MPKAILCPTSTASRIESASAERTGLRHHRIGDPVYRRRACRDRPLRIDQPVDHAVVLDMGSTHANAAQRHDAVGRDVQPGSFSIEDEGGERRQRSRPRQGARSREARQHRFPARPQPAAEKSPGTTNRHQKMSPVNSQRPRTRSRLIALKESTRMQAPRRLSASGWT